MNVDWTRAMKVAAVLVFVAHGVFAKALGYEASDFTLSPAAKFWLTEAVEGFGLLLLFLPRPSERPAWTAPQNEHSL